MTEKVMPYSGKFGRRIARLEWKRWQKAKGYNKRFRGENPKETWEYHQGFTWLAFCAQH